MRPAFPEPRIARWALLLAGALALQSLPAAVPIAELEQRVATAAPAQKSAALVELASGLEPIDMARAWEVAQEARRAARTPTEELAADLRLGSLQRRRGDYAEAMAGALAGLERATALRDERLRSEFLFLIAQTHWSLAEYPAAVESYQTVIQLAEPQGWLELVARAENGIGIVHAETKQWEIARQHYHRALAIADQLKSDDLRAWVLNNLGLYYNAVGDPARARATHEEALALRRAAGDLRGQGDSLVNLGTVALQAGDAAAALDFTRRALSIYEQLGLKRHIVNARRDAAAALRALGRADEALEQLQLALPVAETLGSQTVLANIFREFAATYEARKDYRSALEYTRRLATASEAAHDQTSRRRMDELQARFAAERRQHEIALLRGEQARQDAELQRTRWQRYVLAIALISAAVVFVAIVSRYRLKRRTDRRILAEARAARTAAEDADRVKTRFLGIASHDIRGPLGNIVHLAAGLRPGGAGHADQEIRGERLDLINSEAQRVLCLVEDLITTAALETGRLEIRHAPLDLGQLAVDAIASLRWQAEAKRQTLSYSAPSAGTGRMRGDAARLHQVIANLLSNAIKFSPPGSVIAVQLARAGDKLTLTVRDQGAGITPEDATRLFAPFERLATHPTAGESSHGLGLSIAQEIAHLHGGAIRLDSKPGLGSTFILELPSGDLPARS